MFWKLPDIATDLIDAALCIAFPAMETRLLPARKTKRPFMQTEFQQSELRKQANA